MHTTERYEAGDTILDVVVKAVYQNTLLEKASHSRNDKFLYDIVLHVVYYLREECSSEENMLPRNKLLAPTFGLAGKEWRKIYNHFLEESVSDVEFRQMIAHFYVHLSRRLCERFFLEADHERAENPQAICRLPMGDRP